MLSPRTFHSHDSALGRRRDRPLRRPSRALGALAAALSLLLGATVSPVLAAAPSAPAAQRPVPARQAQARRHFRRGEAAFAKGDFRAALIEYDRAFRLVPLAGLLFNIGQCHRNLGAHERAIYSYQLYLARLPQAPNREAVLALIAELKPLVVRPDAPGGSGSGAQGQTKPSSPRTGAPFDQTQGNQDVVVWGEGPEAGANPTGDATGEPRRPTSGKRTGVEGEATGALLTPPLAGPPQPARPLYRRWWFWTAVSTAIAAGVAAVGVHYANQPRHHELPPSTLPVWVLPRLR